MDVTPDVCRGNFVRVGVSKCGEGSNEGGAECLRELYWRGLNSAKRIGNGVL